MFNSKRVFGLAVITIASVLSGCGGSGGSQAELPVCNDGDVYDQTTSSCVTRPYVCSTGTRYPDGFVPDETSTQADCEDIPFEAGPAPTYFPADDEVVIYFNRQHVDGLYDGYRIHRWGDCWTETPGWPGTSITAAGLDPTYGAYFVVPIDPTCIGAPNTGNPNVIINTDGDQTDDYNITVQSTGLYARMGFLIAGDSGGLRGSAGAEYSTALPICLLNDAGDTCTAPPPPARLVVDFAAHWATTGTFTWSETGATNVVLYSDPDGGGFDQDGNGAILVDGDIVQPGTDADGNDIEELCTTDACVVDGTVPAGGRLIENGVVAVSTLTESGTAGTYNVDTALTDDQVKDLIKGSLLVAGATGGGQLVGTYVQTHEVIEDLYVGDGTAENGLAEIAELGLTYSGDSVTASVWAPTATEALLKTYSAGSPRFLLETETMTVDAATGVWSVTLDAASVDGLYYLYEVVVPEPFSGELSRVLATDPYSVSASEDSIYSQFVNIDADALKPANWDTHTIPASVDAEDAVEYEVHVREFSIRDASTSEAARGGYVAFTESSSAPVTYLSSLADAGVTHVNLLPIFDFAGVTEQDGWNIELTDSLRDFCNRYRGTAPSICPRVSQSLTIQEALAEVLTLPDDGDWTAAAAYEEVVTLMQDVDGYNWGYAPVLFNVPEGGYASDPDGSDRILETRQMIMAIHEMGLRVSMDVAYGYANNVGMESPFSNLDKLVPGYYFNRDSVTGAYSSDAPCCGDGSDTATGAAMYEKFVEESLVLWTEAYKIDQFNFDNLDAFSTDMQTSALAAVEAANADGLTASFVSGTNDSLQGALASLALTDLYASKAALDAQLAATTITQDEYDDAWADLDKSAIDQIRVGLAGGLANFPYYNAIGRNVTGASAPVGASGTSPQENTTYVSAHDTQTLWDMMHTDDNYPLVSALTAAQKADAQLVYLSIPMFSQGSSLFQMGSELLRSKAGAASGASNAGDWVTYVDFTQSGNNWGVADPSRSADVENASPLAADIAASAAAFAELLDISTSPLFSLESADEVIARVGFHNQGEYQTPGLILMSIDDGDTMSSDLDGNFDAILVAFNATPNEITQAVNTAEGFAVHSSQTLSGQGASFTEAVDGDGNPAGEFTIPALSTVVFVKAQSGAAGPGLSRDASPAPAAAQAGTLGGTAFFIRGGMNGWGAPATSEFAFVGRNKYMVTMDITAGSYEFKVASDDWSTVDFGNPTAVTLDGAGVELTTGGANIPITLAADATVNFVLDATDITAPVLYAETIPYATTTDFFIRGGMNGWGTGDAFIYEGLGIYRTTRTVDAADAGELQFKVASDDWATVDFGAASQNVTFGTPLALEAAGANLIATFGAADYAFTLDASDPAAPEITVVESNPYSGGVYIRGGMNGWGTDNLMLLEGPAIYAVDFSTPEGTGIAAGTYEFKVASEDWSTVDLGADGVSNVVTPDGTGYDLVATGGNLSVTIAADGNYRFEVDVSTGVPVLTVIEIR